MLAATRRDGLRRRSTGSWIGRALWAFGATCARRAACLIGCGCIWRPAAICRVTRCRRSTNTARRATARHGCCDGVAGVLGLPAAWPLALVGWAGFLRAVSGGGRLARSDPAPPTSQTTLEGVVVGSGSDRTRRKERGMSRAGFDGDRVLWFQSFFGGFVEGFRAGSASRTRLVGCHRAPRG